MLILAFKLYGTQFTQFISIKKKLNKTETNEAWYESSLVTFYNNKWGFVYTVRQLLITEMTVVEGLIGTFRLDYECKIKFEYEFRISNQ